MGWRLLILAHASRNWPSVEGRVTTSEITKANVGGEQVSWQPKIEYTYKVDCRDYVSKTIGYHMSGGTTADASSMTVADYPSGKSVSVFYDPTRPSRSVLEPGPSPNNWILVMITTILNAMILYALIWK